LESGKADLVLLHQVLHHLDRPALALREASRLLAPQGTVLVVDFANHDRDDFRDEFAHRRLGFEVAEMMDLLNEHGFDAIRVERLGGLDDRYPDLLIGTARRTSSLHPASNLLETTS
jgi:SAM-dependent methyltransferase